jgi:hypothetical protein
VAHEDVGCHGTVGLDLAHQVLHRDRHPTRRPGQRLQWFRCTDPGGDGLGRPVVAFGLCALSSSSSPPQITHAMRRVLTLPLEQQQQQHQHTHTHTHDTHDTHTHTTHTTRHTRHRRKRAGVSECTLQTGGLLSQPLKNRSPRHETGGRPLVLKCWAAAMLDSPSQGLPPGASGGRQSSNSCAENGARPHALSVAAVATANAAPLHTNTRRTTI